MTERPIDPPSELAQASSRRAAKVRDANGCATRLPMQLRNARAVPDNAAVRHVAATNLARLKAER